MGEAVMSTEEDLEIMEILKEEEEKKKMESKDGSTRLPKMGLRVLLVEYDDSTRQIISALLRKCNYKVASVADGLKAWELLKARPHNIDLILTEAELPSISGYALLTLIMEHEVCKNIPVILMSTNDPISMVYKCMLRGASDFLIKPIRINELKNLWQHVWRRKHQLNRGGGLSPQDESVGLEKLEATAENNAASDHSSSSKTCAPRQQLCNKKGIDAQSYCGKQNMEDESAYLVEVEDNSQTNQGISPVLELIIQENGKLGNSSQNLQTPESAVAGLDTAACNSNNAITEDQKAEKQSCEENVTLYTEDNDVTNIHTKSAREAIDLIGALDCNSKHSMCLNNGGNRSEPCQQLDLTLRRFFPGVIDNKTCNENQTLNHSNASAFTRYVNKASNSNHRSVSTPKDNTGKPGDHSSDNAPERSYSAKDPLLSYDRNVISLSTNLAKEVENEYRAASEKLFPMPLPVNGMQIDVCPMACTPSLSPSASSANQQVNSFHQFSIDVINGRHHFHPLDQSPNLSSNQPMSMQDQNKLESLEERAHFSSAADQSASSSLLNETAVGHLTGGSSEGGNDHSRVSCELTRQRSLQREAALNKFRLKRKERCYEKKVRYESRKKLAEQRPRVKGQFVRQVPPDPPPLKSNHSGGNSTAS